MKALGHLVEGLTASLANLLSPQPVNFLVSIGRAASAVAGDPQAARSWDVVPILMITPDRWPDDLAGAPLRTFIDERAYGIDDQGVFTETLSRLAAKAIGEELCVKFPDTPRIRQKQCRERRSRSFELQKHWSYH